MYHHFKLALRHLRNNGIYSVVNISGLAIGMAAAMLIMLWVYNQWSYDRFHEKKDHIYSVWSHNERYGDMEWTSQIIGPTLVEDYADVVNMTRFKHNSGKQLMTVGDKQIRMEVSLADPGFLTMFGFPLLEGDVHTALNDPQSIVITKDAAKRLFGDEDPMGKTLMRNTNRLMRVTGVMADLPGNTRFEFDALIPFVTLKESGSYNEDWISVSNYTYVELRAGTNSEQLTATIKDIIKQHTDGKEQTSAFLNPMTQWNLYSEFKDGKPVGGHIEMLRLFTLIAVLILLIACINFMNLSTARSANRACEVGVRKVIGARKRNLVWQFLGESVLTAAIAFVFSLIMVYMCLPFFNMLMGEQLYLNFGNIFLWLVLLVFVLLTGILAGSYPAFYLSSFLPIKVLKGVFKGRQGLVTPRKLLIITQFTFTVVLLISTMVIHKQIKYAQDRPVGYDRNQLVYVETTGPMRKNFELLRQDLLGTGAVESVTRTLSPMTQRWATTWGIGWQGGKPDDRIVFDRYFVDAGWAKTTGVTIVQGRDIDIYTYATDSTAMLLNETAVKVMGFDNPIGQIIRDMDQDWHVVGVVKDFIQESPYEPTTPMIVGGASKAYFGILNIKLSDANRVADNLARIEPIFKTYNPDYPFEYTFVDESYAHKFASEQRTGTLASWFAGLTIFISCLGLFGLSAYMAENRRKEIGVRKVLGASITNIVSLLSKEFLILVSISLIIAIPIAWWAMGQWLEGFAYRTNMPWWLFVAVAALTIAIALFTVSFQAIKAATANPVKAIKAE